MDHLLPDIFYFNPTCEYAVANGSRWWQPNQLLRKMEEDMDTLPMFLAKESDVVLVHRIPSHNFKESLQNAGIGLPEFRLLKDSVASETFRLLPKNRLLPWGWSPAVHHLLEPLKPSCSESYKNSPVSRWSDIQKNIRSKIFALSLLEELIPLLPAEHSIQKDGIAQVCTTRGDIEEQMEKWEKVMVKLPWSSSGRGLQPVTRVPVHEKVWEKLLGMIREQGAVLVEPYLNKVYDLAFQFECTGGRISYIGTSHFITDKKGQYQGNYLNSIPADTPPEIKQFTEGCVSWLPPRLIEVLEHSDLAKNYEGRFGVDTLVFTDSNNRLRIHPCLELNVRQNMGLVSLELEKLLAPGSRGLFNIWFSNKTSYAGFAEEMQARHPVRMEAGKIASGFISLTEPAADALFGACMQVWPLL